jgi:medium-chain acyl-[acyl-carrier-protein] hydrolase
VVVGPVRIDTLALDIRNWSVMMGGDAETAPYVDDPVEVVCLPFAGGGRRSYASWTRLLPPTIQAETLDLPGRETRFSEDPCNTIECLIDDLAPRLGTSSVKVIFGHSMGALVAFELTRALEARRASPRCLVVSGMMPPRLVRVERRMHLEPDEELRNWLLSLGGLEDAMPWMDDLWDAMSRTIRADISIVENYRYRAGPPLHVPIIAYGSFGDGLTDEALAPWLDETRGSFESRCFHGGHFYFSEWPEVFVSDFVSRVLRYAA